MAHIPRARLGKCDLNRLPIKKHCGIDGAMQNETGRLCLLLMFGLDQSYLGA